MRSLHSDNYKKFISVLAETRRRADVSQQVLADRLGKPQSFVSKYERGERRLDVVEFLLIAHALESGGVELLRRIEKSLFESNKPLLAAKVPSRSRRTPRTKSMAAKV